MKTLTLEQAIEQGYKYFIIEHCEEHPMLLDKSKDYSHDTLVLCEIEPRLFTIDESSIEELISDNIDSGEEFYMDEGLSPTALEGCEDLIKQLADRINANMAKINFWFPSDIRLTIHDHGKEGETNG